MKSSSSLSILLTFAFFGLAGCAGDPWAAYDASLYTTLREPSADTYEAHLALLIRIVDSRESKGTSPPPGICAECAFYLHRAGRGAEASAYLAKEKQYYPESSTVVAALERVIAGQPAIDSSEGDSDAADKAKEN